MPPKKQHAPADKLTDSDKKKIKQYNKQKANPELAERKSKKNEACRDRRTAAGSKKSFA